jgi:hypothetical protein
VFAFVGAVIDFDAAAVCVSVSASGVAGCGEEGGGYECFLYSEKWVFGEYVCAAEWFTVLVFELYAGLDGV